MWGDQEKRLPVFALSYNHRACAFYRADAEDSQNVNVESVRKRGLKRVRILASWTPEFVLRFLSTVHNRFHRGSGASVIEICKTALQLEASWRAACDHSGMSTNNPGYAKAYEAACCFCTFAGCLRRRVQCQLTFSGVRHVPNTQYSIQYSDSDVCIVCSILAAGVSLCRCHCAPMGRMVARSYLLLRLTDLLISLPVGEYHDLA